MLCPHKSHEKAGSFSGDNSRDFDVVQVQKAPLQYLRYIESYLLLVEAKTSYRSGVIRGFMISHPIAQLSFQLFLFLWFNFLLYLRLQNGETTHLDSETLSMKSLFCALFGSLLDYG